MSAEVNPSSREFFESMYARNTDPWNFANDVYERSRYDALLAALSGQRFARAFEPGCSVGVLTSGLAPYCGNLLACDLSEKAVIQARERCAGHPNVNIQQGSVADADPGPLDLLVLSEIGYYFASGDLAEWADRLLSRLEPGGTLLAAHWLGFSADHTISGDEVHDILHGLARKRQDTLNLTQRTPNFRLDKWTRNYEPVQR